MHGTMSAMVRRPCAAVKFDARSLTMYVTWEVSLYSCNSERMVDSRAVAVALPVSSSSLTVTSLKELMVES